MEQYLKRVMIDPEIDGVDPWYYANKGKVSIHKLDDVMISLDKPFVCPDCSGTFLFKTDYMAGHDEWFRGKYQCHDCRAMFEKR